MSGGKRHQESQKLRRVAAINAFKARCRLEVAVLRDDLRGLFTHGKFKEASRCESRLELVQRLAERGPIGA